MPRVYETTVASILGKVRTLVQDKTQPYRAADSEIIGWINDCIKTVVSLVPQLFIASGSHVCTDGYRQTIINTRAHAVVDVIGVPVADLATLTQFYPGWQAATHGAIQNWMRPVNEPLSFYTYPPSDAGQDLTISFVEVPEDLTSSADFIPLPESYAPAIVSYCVAMVEAKDDESIDTNRAQQSMTDFVGRIRGVGA